MAARSLACLVGLLAIGANATIGAAAPEAPLVDEPPPAGEVCPAIEEDYELCSSDPWSSNCRDFVAAAGALRQLYLYRLQHELATADQMQAMIFWPCGEHDLQALAQLLTRINSPEANDLLAVDPFRRALSAEPTANAQRPALAPGTPVDCDTASTEADSQACAQRELEAVKARHEAILSTCRKTLPDALLDQVTAEEREFRATLDGECVQPDCIARMIRERDASILQAFPQCGARDASTLPERPARSLKTGMLPAHWTPADGSSEPVPFSFEAESPAHGTLSTTLGKGGETFHGTYVRLEDSTKGHLVTEVYDGFSSPEWESWQHDPSGEWTESDVAYGEFARFYSGKVVAALSGNRGSKMRCQMELKAPQLGLGGGGSGKCQVSSGGLVRLDF